MRVVERSHMPASTRPTNPERTRQVQAFLHDGVSDYIAARVLFLSRLPQQAAILSSTAIEKCFKAMLAFRGNECHGHLQTAHWNAVKAFDKNVSDRLSKDFIELNRRAYLLRYTEALPIGFNLVIATREFLAELDHTIYWVQQGFRLTQDGKARHLIFEHLRETGDHRLCSENHVLRGVPKDVFVAQGTQYVYEVRNDGLRGLMEVVYETAKPATCSGFLRPGVNPGTANGRSYELSHEPLPDALG